MLKSWIIIFITSFFYHLRKLCIPQGEKVNVIREAHTSLIVGHFGVGKIVAQLYRYWNWPRMNEIVSNYVKGCSMCATSKPSNRKLGLYNSIPIPSHPWESIYMDFVRGLLMSRKGNDYLYVVVDHFSKICVLMPSKKQITAEKTAKMLFQNVWVHFGLPTSIFFIEIVNLSGSFFQVYGNSWRQS